MGALSKLPNIGPVVEQQLLDVGIHTLDDLRALGAEGAWLKIQTIDSSACIHRLYSLEGAIWALPKPARFLKKAGQKLLFNPIYMGL